MTENQILRFPGIVRTFRMAAGMQQQALADKLGMGSAALCALEKGRRPVPDSARVAAIGAALGLTPADLAVLHRWAKHDRLVAHLQSDGLEDAVPLLSQALQCSWHLNPRQRVTVCAELARHTDALTRVALLNGVAHQGEGNAM